MTKKPRFFDDSHNSTYQTGLNLVAQGWSIIPLLGDARPDMSKAPALPSWKVYQTQQPSQKELFTWFSQNSFTVIGVVLGQISGVVVIDIDNVTAGDIFAKAFPDLIDTFTVRSGNRGLPHYYFRLPAGLSVPVKRADGIELRSDGQYVVAPGSCINGREWRVVDNRLPKILTERDLSRLLTFFHVVGHDTGAKSVKTDSGANLRHSESVRQPHIVTRAGLLRFYRHRAERIGRNNALFEAARYARDYGWTEKLVLSVLVAAHAHQNVTTGDIVVESSASRKREARRTIASVFSQPARPPQLLNLESPRLLPNTVREALLQNRLDNASRLLDALLLIKIGAGEQLNPALLYDRLRDFGIGRNMIYTTLKTCLPDGVPLFAKSPPLTPPSDFAIAGICPDGLTKQCLFGGGTKPGKTPGRPVLSYLMPDVESLCERLNVAMSWSDPLKPEALRSPAAYRAALHRALFERVPGQYPRAWQAARLGVSVQTCRRYDRRVGVQVQAVYHSQVLDWHNLQRIIPDDPFAGHFIEDSRGTRYPPLMGVARRLLARGQRIYYRVQDANHYSVPCQHDPTMSPVVVSPAVTIQEESAHNVTTGDNSEQVATMSPVVVSPAVTTREESAHNVTTGDNSKVLPPRIIDHTPQLDCAERLYRLLRARNPRRSMTRRNVQRLVESYGELLIERGMKLLRMRQDIRNPAGFITVWLRSQVERKQAVQEPVSDASDWDVDPVDLMMARHEAWLESLRESPYAAYLINADEVLGDSDSRANVTTGDILKG